MALKSRLFTAVFALLLYACAQQTAPTGGDKDETPPRPVSIKPPNLSTQFSAKEFEIVFDEYIQVDDFKDQLLVSPPFKKKPEYQLRGKTLRVTWEEDMLPGTTYQFNFGEAIKDFTEGNVNDTLIYVCSTGDYIDSLSIHGSVFDALSNEPVPKVKVMLYRQWEDSLPYTTPPDYLAITNERGEFNARFLPPDTFKLFALEESSSNYKYDGPPERIAFLDYFIISTYRDSLDEHVFALFEEADTSQYIKDVVSKDYGYYEVIFNLPAEEVGIRFLNPESEIEEEIEAVSILNSSRDTLKNWLNLSDYEEIEEITVILRESDRMADTSDWYLETDPKFRDKPKLKITSSASGGNIDPKKPVSIRFNYPLERMDTTLIKLIEDSVEVSDVRYELSNVRRRLDIHYPFRKDAGYELIAEEGAFKDIYGKFSDSLGYAFGSHPDEYYGSLRIKIMLDKPVKEGHFIAILHDSNENEVGRLATRKSTRFKLNKLPPGKYKLMGIYDRNDNGEWDTGIHRERLQPERQAFYSEDIDVRSNWDLDVDWIPSTPFDASKWLEDERSEKNSKSSEAKKPKEKKPDAKDPSGGGNERDDKPEEGED